MGEIWGVGAGGGWVGGDVTRERVDRAVGGRDRERRRAVFGCSRERGKESGEMWVGCWEVAREGGAGGWSRL